MQPDGTLRGDAVYVGGDARQRFYDSRGYGRPVEGNEIALTRVEAAHLLFRGDLSTVAVDGDELGFEAFFVDVASATDRFAVRFLVYADLRDRGLYLSPVRAAWPGDDHAGDGADFAVYERGDGPSDAAPTVAHEVRVVGEREPIAAAGIAGHTLAIVDEESDLTYFEATDAAAELDGDTRFTPPGGVRGVLLSDRVVVWSAPPELYQHGFYGQPLEGRAAVVEDAIQLSLVEAASLAAAGRLELAGAVDGGGDAAGADGAEAIRDRGRAVEGNRFDRRLAVYEDLRDRDTVPKTGFKFGADFRTYLDVDTVADLPHSEHLIRVVEPDHAFVPRELSLDVRLAGGVRKRMVFALTDGDAISYVAVGRITP